jgi:Zn finger protein HypA/HybF involved in hydrogenase expression
MKERKKICEKCGHEFYANENWSSSLCPECENKYIEIHSGNEN